MTVLTLFYGPQNPAKMLEMIGDAVQQQQAIGTLDNGKSHDKSDESLEKTIRAATAGMPSLAEIQGASTLSPSAQRNLIQKYIKTIRPMVEQQINLPPNSMRLGNAGKGEQSIRSNQKPGTLIQKNAVNKAKAQALPASKAKSVVSDKASTVGTLRSTASTVPRTAGLSSTGSTIAPSSSISTAPSSKAKIVPAHKAPVKPWAMQEKAAKTASAKTVPKITTAPKSPVSKITPAVKPTLAKPATTSVKAAAAPIKPTAAPKKPAPTPTATPLTPKKVANGNPAASAPIKSGSKPILKPPRVDGAPVQKSTKNVKFPELT